MWPRVVSVITLWTRSKQTQTGEVARYPVERSPGSSDSALRPPHSVDEISTVAVW